jgi:uncharacterized protein
MRGHDRLLELQELDLSAARLRPRRRELESGAEVAAARVQKEELEETLGTLRLALDSVSREQGRLEGEVGMIEKKLESEERRLYDGSVANPKELEAIQAEIGGLRNRQRRIEDELLGQMERREDLEGRLPTVEQDLEESRHRLSELEASSERELGDIERSLREREGERESLVPVFDEELLELYEDLRAQKKGVGVAVLEDGVCQGCHQKLSPLELDRIKAAEGVRRCDYCRRILVIT